MNKYITIRNEIDGNPALYGSMSNPQVADELNASTKAIRGGISGMLLYLLENKNRTNSGTDTVTTPILGRLHQVADSAVDSDPFASGSLVTLRGKHAAQSFLDLLQTQHLSVLDFESLNLPYSDCIDMGIWKTADVDALKALSMNQTTRGIQIGVGRVDAEDVRIARAQ